MRVFPDTNVLVASFISRGACAELFEYCLAAHMVCLNGFVLVEFEAALKKLKFSQPLIKPALALISANSLVVEAAAPAAPVCRDKDDDAVLAGALKAEADCLVTGDEDLLVLKEYEGIPIVRPAEFWRFEKGFTL